MRATAMRIAALFATGCFSPRPTPGQPCESWCPPPESCVAGTCELTPLPGDAGNGSGGADAATPIQGNYMFVTSETKTPTEIGGLAGGDAWCNQLASDAHLPGHYTAWLSSSTMTAHDRLAATNARGWYRPDGKPFADTLDDLTTTGKIFYPPRITERNSDLVALGLDPTVATGSYANGADAPGYDCDGFTDAVGMVSTGFMDAGSVSWAEAASSTTCSTSVRIYCFGDSENQYAVAPAPQTGVRRAFITRMGVTIGTTGRGAMDAKCAAEATALGVTGTFLAWLPLIGSPANARFGSGAPWVRSDNVTAIAGDFSAMTAPLDVDLTGKYQQGLAWGGAPAPDQAPSTSSPYDCNDWFVTSGESWAGDVSRGSFVPAVYTPGDLILCSNQLYLYCLEQ